MKNNLAGVLIIMALIGAGFWAGCNHGTGRADADHTRALAAAARAAGDSAVAAFVSSESLEALVGEALQDTVRFYEGELAVAAVIEIQERVVTITDTVRIVGEGPGGGEDISVVTLPPYDSIGVHIAETLTLAPALMSDTEIERALTVTFDPDTLTVALLNTAGGLQRVSAYLSEHTGVRVVNAAALWKDRPPSLLSKVGSAVGVGSCLASGVVIGRAAGGGGLQTEGQIGIAVGGGLLCLRQIVRSFR
jgi:hypothetical protein